MTETSQAGTLKTKESMDKQHLCVDKLWWSICFPNCVKHKWHLLGRCSPMQKPRTALEMLWREHVYWFYCCNHQQKNASRMLAHCTGPSTDAIPVNLLLFITTTQRFLPFPQELTSSLITNIFWRVRLSGWFIWRNNLRLFAKDLLSSLVALLRMTRAMKHGNPATDFTTTLMRGKPVW